MPYKSTEEVGVFLPIGWTALDEVLIAAKVGSSEQTWWNNCSQVCSA